MSQDPNTQDYTSRYGRIIKWVVVLFVLIPILIFTLLQFPGIQNWVGQRMVNTLSNKIGAKVELSKVNFSLTKGVVLEDLYIQNQSQDTLLFLGSASTDLMQNLVSLINNRLYLNTIQVSDVYINIEQASGDSLSNFQQMLNKLSSQEKGTGEAGKEFSLGINEIYLWNLNYKSDNRNSGVKVSLGVKEGLILVDTLNFAKNHFSLEEINFINPVCHISKDNIDPIVFESKMEVHDSLKTNNESLIEVDIFCLSNGLFSFNDLGKEIKQSPVNALDYAHFSLEDLQINSQDFKLINSNQALATIHNISFKEENGFKVKALRINDFYLSEKTTELNGFSLETHKSYIKDKIEFEYDELSDFSDFESKVKLDVNFNNSSLSIHDLVYFFSDIYGNEFIKKNYDKGFLINGRIRGTVDRLSANNLTLSFDKYLDYKGRLSIRNLTDIENATISFKIDQLKTSIPKLKAIVPNFKPPQNFDLLGEINYKGRFNGSIFDFVSFGTFSSALGLVNTDIRMDLKEGINNANYFGNLELVDFDLKTWSGNEDFGDVSFVAEIKNGRGLKLENAYADLAAELRKFSFKGYDYQNVEFDGQIDRSKFAGELHLKDENVNLDFLGNIEYNEGVIIADFDSEIQKLNLQELNLSDEELNVTGNFDIELVGTGINDFVGDASLKNLKIKRKGKDYDLPDLSINSAPSDREGRLVGIESDIVNAELEGVFNLEDLTEHFKSFFHEFYPGWAERLQLQKAKELKNDQDFTIDLQISDSKDYFELIDAAELKIKGLTLKTNANLSKDIILSDLQIDEFYYDNLSIKNVDLYLENDKQFGNYRFQSDSLTVGNRSFNPIEIIARLERDSARFEINTFNLLDSFEKMELVTELYPTKDGVKLSFSEKEWEMLGADWSFNKKNEVLLSNNKIYIQDLVLSDGDRSLSLSDVENEGVKLDFKGFDFLLINDLIDYDKIDFGGVGDISIIYDNIFKAGNIELDYTIPDFTLNGDSYGMLKLIASSVGDDIVGAVLRIYRSTDQQDIKVEGVYNTKTKEVDAELISTNFNLRLFEYIIDDGISDTKGTAKVDARLKGTIDDPSLYGEVKLNNGGTRINYLGNFVRFDNQEITLTETFVDLNGLQIKDRLGNTATFSGGLEHYFLGDFALNLNISSPRFLALDTDRADNPLYYGKGLGNISLKMTGDFGSPNFVVNAITGAGSELNIPIESSQSDFDESFIKFINREDVIPGEVIVTQAAEIEGVNFDMNLTVNEDALFNIIFDERQNDVIKGRGRGDIQVQINRRGDFEVYGDYEVESGEYLFTAWGIVAKPFTVKRGGTITWTGDPFNATLNIEAFYEDLRAPLNIFLAEYLVAETGAAQEAKNRTDVDLELKITGLLYNPNVQFDMHLPNLTGELKSYADSKMRTLRANESELNDQVAGLILFGTFLPTNSGSGGGVVTGSSIIGGGYHTLSEMIGNQLSFLLSGILDEAFTENGLITGIDFDIGFNKNTEIIEGELTNTSFIPDEVEVHLRPKFSNDRWGIDVGTNYVRQSAGSGAIENYVVNDFIIEYFLTKDRRLKLRAYAKNDYDVFVAQREQIFGIGLNYRKEFGSISELTDRLKKDIEKDINELDKGGSN